MKKFVALIWVCISLFSLCSCKEKGLLKGTVLFDCGISSIDKISSCIVDNNSEESASAAVTAFEINKKEREKLIGILAEYEYAEDYPSNKMHNLFVFPGPNVIKITFDGGEAVLYHLENGDIVILPSDDSAPKIYRAEENLTQKDIDNLTIKR